MSKNYKPFIASTCKQHAKTEDEVIEALFDKNGDELTPKENAQSILDEWDANRVSGFNTRIKETGTAKFNDGHKAAKGEVLAQYEAEIRTEYPDIKSDKKGKELIAEIIAIRTAATGGKKVSDMSVEEIKKHPAFIELENKKVKDYEDKLAETQKKYENLVAEGKRDKLVTYHTKFVDEYLTKHTPVKKTAEVFINLKNLLIDDLAKYETQKIEGDQEIVLKDGVRVDNAHGHAIKYLELLEEKTRKYFDFVEQDAKGNTGNDGKGQGQMQIPGLPKNDEEFLAKHRELKNTDPEAAAKLAYDYNKAMKRI